MQNPKLFVDSGVVPGGPGVQHAAPGQRRKVARVRADEQNRGTLFGPHVRQLPGKRKLKQLPMVVHRMELRGVNVLLRNLGIVTEPEFESEIRLHKGEAIESEIVTRGPRRDGQEKQRYGNKGGAPYWRASGTSAEHNPAEKEGKRQTKSRVHKGREPPAQAVGTPGGRSSGRFHQPIA